MRSRIVVNNGEAMRDMAIAGLGLALLPDFLASEPLRDGRLIPVLPHEIPLPYTVSVVYPSTRYASNKVRTFIDHLIRYFAPSSPWERTIDGSLTERPRVR